MSVTRTGPAYQVVAKLAAALETLVPEDYAPLVAGESQVDLDLSRADNGEIAVNSATLKSEGVDFAAHGVVERRHGAAARRAFAEARAGGAGGAAVPRATCRSRASARPPGSIPATQRHGVSQIAAEGVEGDFGRVDGLALDATGQAQNLARPDARAASFKVSGSAEGVVLADADLRDAIGASVKLNGAGSWSAGQPVDIDNLQVTMPGASATFAGTATREIVDGTFAASIGDLSRFGAIAGRPLAGGVDLQARGSATTSGMFDLTLDGTATKLALGIAALDPLLGGDDADRRRHRAARGWLRLQRAEAFERSRDG